MTRSLFILPGLAVFLLWSSCAGGKDGVREAYGAVLDSGAAGRELIAAMEDFEVRHSGHFDSKVDLGIFYLAAGEMEKAGDYLHRAEGLLAEEGAALASGEGKVPALYGALGQWRLLRKEYGDALEYTDMAIQADGEGRQYFRFLKGRILAAQNEYDAALEIFDRALAEAEEGEAGTEEIRTYMFLLAQAERPVEAAAVLDGYFRTGEFFPGLGFFGAALYRAAGEAEKAAYALYLEQEYRSGYGGLGSPAAGSAEAAELPETAAGGPGESGDSSPGEVSERHFAAEYRFLKALLSNESAGPGGEPGGDFGAGEFLRLAELEPYFRLFPSFYWYLWQGARRAYPESYQYFSSALQKIVALDRDGPFAKGAWEELTRLMGY